MRSWNGHASWCFPEAAAKAVSCRLQSLVFQRAQKQTLGTGTGASEAPLGLAYHAVFPFRKRPPKQSAACRLRRRREAVAPGLRKRCWDRHAMVITRFGSGRQRRQLQASKASFLAGSESDIRNWHRGLRSAVGTACHGVFPFRQRPPKQSAAGSESDVRQWHRGFGSAVGTSMSWCFPFRDVRHWQRGLGSAVATGMPWCFPVLEAAAKAATAVSCRLKG